jgi:hypothetical protein
MRIASSSRSVNGHAISRSAARAPSADRPGMTAMTNGLPVASSASPISRLAAS